MVYKWVSLPCKGRSKMNTDYAVAHQWLICKKVLNFKLSLEMILAKRNFFTKENATFQDSLNPVTCMGV